MTANSRQMKLLRGPFSLRRGAGGYVCRMLLLLALLLSGLALPGRSCAAATTVVTRQTNEALAASAQHAVLPALLPGTEVAAPQPLPDPLPLAPALFPAAVLLPAETGPGLPPTAARRPAQPAHRSAAARLTSEVPNGP